MSSLYSKFSDLEIVWEKAGGNPGQLSEKNNTENSWFVSLIEADKGKIKGGITHLLEIILQDYPNNERLRDISNFLLSNKD